MATSVAISGCNDELFSSSRADGSDGSLVILKNEGGWYIVGLVINGNLVSGCTFWGLRFKFARPYLIHETEYNLLIAFEPPSQFSPKSPKLRSRCGFRIRRVSNYASRHRLLRRVIVAHVVVWVENCVGSYNFT